MIEIKEVIDLGKNETNKGTDFENYIAMVSKSEFGKYTNIRDGYILYEDDKIPTKEVIFNTEIGLDIVIVFCASDESYVTTEIR